MLKHHAQPRSMATEPPGRPQVGESLLVEVDDDADRLKLVETGLLKQVETATDSILSRDPA